MKEIAQKFYGKVKVNSNEVRLSLKEKLKKAGFFYSEDMEEDTEHLLIGNMYVGEMCSNASFEDCTHKEYLADEILSMEFIDGFCGDCDSFCECGFEREKNDKACPAFDDSYCQFKKNQEEAK